jgi:hypothetical protein
MGGRAVPLFPKQNGPNRPRRCPSTERVPAAFRYCEWRCTPQLRGFFAVGAGAIVSAPAPPCWCHKSSGPGVARRGHLDQKVEGISRNVLVTNRRPAGARLRSQSGFLSCGLRSAEKALAPQPRALADFFEPSQMIVQFV